MLSWVVRNLKGVQLEATVTLSDVVDAGDVGAHFINHLHELRDKKSEASTSDHNRLYVLKIDCRQHLCPTFTWKFTQKRQKKIRKVQRRQIFY